MFFQSLFLFISWLLNDFYAMVGSQVTFRSVKHLSSTFFNGWNMFFICINMLTFYFSPSKNVVQLLVLQKFSIITFDLSFKVNSYVGTKNIFNLFFNSKITHVASKSLKWGATYALIELKLTSCKRGKSWRLKYPFFLKEVKITIFQNIKGKKCI